MIKEEIEEWAKQVIEELENLQHYINKLDAKLTEER